MSCGAIDPGNTYLWITIGGIFIGGGLSFLICPRRRRRGTAALVLFSAAILSLLVSLYVYDFRISGPAFRLLWLGGCIIVAYAGFLFWKAVGIPLVFLLVLFISLSWSALMDWSCADAGTGICRFSIISEGEGFRRVTYSTAGGTDETIKIEGPVLYPEISVYRVPEYFFILRSSDIYRFCGFSGNAADETCPGNSGFLSLLMNLPGFYKTEGLSEGLNVSPSINYELEFGADKKIKLIRRI